MGKYANRRKKKNKRGRPPKNALVAKGEALPLHRRYETVTSAPDPDADENIATGFSLKIPEKVFEKIMYWINKASPKEVSGFGHLDFDEDTRQFRVRDAILLDQKVTSGSAEIDAKALGKAMYEHRNEVNALKWHWHSHPTFGVFWSGTDMNLIRELGQQGWILASVFNCKRESRTAYLTTVEVMGKPHDIFVDDIPFKVLKNYSLKDLQEYDKEFDAKVRNEYSGGYSGGYGGGGPYHNPPTVIDKGNKIDTGERTGYPRRIYPSEYDVNGYAHLDGDYIYNPIYDNQVPTRVDAYNVIDEMKDDEIETLMKHDFNFPSIYKDYLESRRTIMKTNEEKYGQEH